MGSARGSVRVGYDRRARPPGGPGGPRREPARPCLTTLALKTETYELGDRTFTVCSLLDGNQFDDPRGEARALGIPEAYWSLFGRLWPSGLELARYLATTPVEARPTIEIGCGLALPGMVLHHRGAAVTVSDHHPFARRFLRRNLRLNGIERLPFRRFDWARPPARLGRFGHVVASDICYAPGQAEDIVRFVERHGTDDVRVTIADPGRPEARVLTRRLRDRGFSVDEFRPDRKGRLRITVYRRG